MALITRANLKIFLGIPEADTSEDTALDLYIAAACAAIETYCAYQLESAAVTEYHSGDGMRELILRNRWVTSIASIYVDPEGYFGEAGTAFGSSTLLTAGEDYALLRNESGISAAGIVIRLNGQVWPGIDESSGLLNALVSGRGNIKITYTAGFTTIPADIQTAAYLMSAMIRRNASAGGPISSFGIDYFNMSFASAQDGMEMASIKQLLSGYTKWVW